MNSTLERIARIISIVFFPGTMVLLGILIVGKNINWYDWLLTISCFLVLPLAQIFIYLKMGKIKDVYMSDRNERHASYIFISVLGILCCLILHKLNSWNELQVWIAAVTMVNITLLVVNNFIKASAHGAASAGFALFCYSWDPLVSSELWIVGMLLWLLVVASRKILNAHTLLELGIGSFIGFFCTFVARQLPWI